MVRDVICSEPGPPPGRERSLLGMPALGKEPVLGKRLDMMDERLPCAEEEIPAGIGRSMPVVEQLRPIIVREVLGQS